MERYYLTGSEKRKHRGNTLVLIIIIALFAVGAAMFLNAATKDPTGPVEQCPWCESDRIADELSAINLPEAPQIELENELNFTILIKSDDDQSRGRLELVITPEGTVEALWKAKYKEDGLEKEFSSASVGNVDSTMMSEGVDENELFFMTKGTFLLQAFKQGNARAGGGEAYVVGWIGPDLSAHGTLVLAPDKKHTKVYHWEKPGI